VITRTADAIVAGDLSRRIERTGSGDDFDHLSATLNAMLDRITGLMENLRQVSNDIAHDLRTPLTRLRQRLELAQRHGDSGAVLAQALHDIDSILETFGALLRIAQIEGGGDGLDTLGAYRRGDLIERGLIPSGHKDVAALIGERQRDSPADAAA